MPSLFVIRHAIAAERGEDWPDDALRPLTHKGEARMREVVARLVTLGVTIDVVLTSPLLRARQTADLLIEGMDPTPHLVLLPELAPGQSPKEVADALGAYRDQGSVGLVGHEPGLGELAAWLIGARSPLPFKKGGVARIDVAALPPSRSEGQLVWLATPKMLRLRD